MSTVKEYLENEKEPTPQWLLDFKPGDKLNVSDIFNSRIVMYPGAGKDGQPIRTFNSAHYAHVFFNVDYLIEKERMVASFNGENCLKGYKLIDLQDIAENELTPNGWRPTVPVSRRESGRFINRDIKPYCIAGVFERKAGFDDSHGAERVLVIALCGDGIATYDALFANRHKAPDVLLVQDHGFGCNWASFGRNSILEEIANVSRAMPKYLCVVDDNQWHGYEKVEGLEPEIGGMHANRRYLYKREG